jgi:translation initiation factor eIF-2B subunit delta
LRQRNIRPFPDREGRRRRIREGLPKPGLFAMDRHPPSHPSLIEILENRDHGASELGRRCLEILAETTRRSKARNPEELVRELTMLAGALSEARPEMAPLRALVGQWADAVNRAPLEDLEGTRLHLIEQAEKIREHSLQAARRIADRAREVLQPGQTILTHSASSVLMAVFDAMRDLRLRVIATESRPRYESHRLARYLAHWDYDVTMITDAQAGIFVAEADAVLTGADRVTTDRTLINKSGTYLIALAAREAGVPFYVACESYKFDPANGSSASPISELPHEEGPRDELNLPELPGLHARNIYFDRTPARFVTAWITDEGIMRNDE